MDAGGPRAITLGWIVVGIFLLCVGASMGKICSACPTAGGLYCWSAKLAKRNSAIWSWHTGWFNLVGQVAITASVDYGLATYVAFLISLYSGSFHAAARWVLVIYAAVLIAHGLLNTFRVKLVGLLANVSVWWHLVGTVVIVNVDRIRRLGPHDRRDPTRQREWPALDRPGHLHLPHRGVRPELAMTFAIPGGDKQYAALAANGSVAGGSCSSTPSAGPGESCW